MAHNLDRDDDQESTVSTTNKQKSSTEKEKTSPLFSRRSYVKLGTLATAAFSATTVGAAESSSVRRDGIEFETVHNAVDDLDMDPTGQETIDSAIADAGDRSLIEFPDGTYRFGSQPTSDSLTGKTRGFEGVGTNVRFLAPKGKQRFLLDGTEMDQVYLDSIEIDQRGEQTCTGVRFSGNRVVVRNIDVLGSCNRRAGGIPLLAHATLGTEKSSLLENIVSTASSTVRPVLGRPGIYIGTSHRGTVAIRDCDLRGFPDPAVEGSRHSGHVQISGSYFENNSASIRISNQGSVIKRCEILVNELPPSVPPVKDSQFHINGITVAQDWNHSLRQDSVQPLTITGTTIRVEELPGTCPAIVVPSAGSPLNIHSSEIEFNNDDRAVILARAPRGDAESRVRQLRIRDLLLRGDGQVDTAIVIKNADDTTIDETSLVMKNGNTDGITVAESGRITIEKTDIQVADVAVIVTDTDGTIRKLSPGQNQSERDSDTRWKVGFPEYTYQTSADTMKHTSETRFRLAGTLESLTIQGDTAVSFANTDRNE